MVSYFTKSLVQLHFELLYPIHNYHPIDYHGCSVMQFTYQRIFPHLPTSTGNSDSRLLEFYGSFDHVWNGCYRKVHLTPTYSLHTQPIFHSSIQSASAP